MAAYNPGSVGDISSLDDIKKVQDYLIKLDRNLKYMFNNLDPEENYSDSARLIYVADKERQASIEVSLEQIALNYVGKSGVVSAINLSDETVQIDASKIRLEGVVTVNGYFKIGLDGSIEATNGKFSGDITASTITGSTFQLNRGANVGFIADGETFQLGDFIVNDWYGRQVLESVDETTGMGGTPNDPEKFYMWAAYFDEDDYVFGVNATGIFTKYDESLSY